MNCLNGKKAKAAANNFAVIFCAHKTSAYICASIKNADMKLLFIALALLFAAGCASERVSLEVAHEIICYTDSGCPIYWDHSRHGLSDTIYTQCPKK